MEEHETADIILDYDGTVSDVYQAATVSALKQSKSLGLLLNVPNSPAKLKILHLVFLLFLQRLLCEQGSFPLGKLIRCVERTPF